MINEIPFVAQSQKKLKCVDYGIQMAKVYLNIIEASVKTFYERTHLPLDL
jgi:hypothetical protein